MENRTRKFILGTADYILLFLTLFAVIYARYGSRFDREVLVRHLGTFWYVYLVYILIFYIFELYANPRRVGINKLISALLINAGLTISYFYIIPNPLITPKTNLMLNIVLFGLLFYPWRKLFVLLFGKVGRTNKVILVGANDHTLAIARQIKGNPDLGFSLTAVYPESEAEKKDILPEFDVPAIKNFTHLKKFITENDIDTVVVNRFMNDSMFKYFYALLPKGISFYDITDFYEELTNRIPIYAADEVWFLMYLRNVSKKLYEFLKRITDIMLVLLVSPLIIVLGILVAVSVKLTSPGPVLFSQVRVGKDGKHFTIYKFRTMRVDAEKEGAQWATKNDSRITGFGKIMRKIRLDEIPQFFNILRGDMNFIGPRPERPEFVEKLSKKIPHYDLRHLIRPGLSGWAQVNFEYAATEEDSAEKLEYDLYYLKNRSYILDIKIVLKTVLTVLEQRGQ